MKEAMLWRKEGKSVRCDLCGRRCLIPENGLGFCLVRKNVKGKLFSLNYGKIISMNIDPIEKKPLFHFYPGSYALSVASAGCNFACKFCFLPDERVFIDGNLVKLEDAFESCNKKIKFKDGLVGLPDNWLTIDGNGKTTKVSKIYKHFFSGKIIKIKPFYFPEIRCTPSHKFLVFNKKNRKLEEVDAAHLTKNHMLLVPKFWYNLQNGKEDVIDIVNTLENFSGIFESYTKFDEEDIERMIQLKSEGMTSREVANLFSTTPSYVRNILSDFRRGKIPQKFHPIKLFFDEDRVWFSNEKKSRIKRKLVVDEDLAFLLGLYCSEGCVIENKKRPNSYSLQFTFGLKEEKLANFVKEKIREKFGVDCKIERRENVINVKSQKSSLALFFKMWCGKDSYSKVVPDFILNTGNDKIILSFLKGLLEGDGYVCDNYLEFTTSSENLAFYTFLLLLKLSYIPSFHRIVPPKKAKIRGREINQNEVFRIRINKNMKNLFLKNEHGNLVKTKGLKLEENFLLLSIRSVKELPYSGFVFNLEVEDDSHSYLCNFISVKNCCNYEISQVFRDKGLHEVVGEEYTPQEIVKIAKDQECKSISYTYTEPTVFFEFAFDTAKLAHKSGIKNTFVTNGYMTPEAVKTIAPYLDAATVDFKGSADPKCYKDFSSVPDVKPIFDCLLEMKKQKIHLEITNLIIPKYGDSLEHFRKLVKWVVDNLGEDIPFHILRFFPTYKLIDLPETSVEILDKAFETAKKEGLKFVYLGNVPGYKEHTYCPKCGEILVERFGLSATKINLKGKKCPKCGTKINIVV